MGREHATFRHAKIQCFSLFRERDPAIIRKPSRSGHHAAKAVSAKRREHLPIGVLATAYPTGEAEMIIVATELIIPRIEMII
jgi:hypothetical protein